MLSTDATVYGLPAVLQYGEMFVQAVHAANPRYTGFFAFSHQRQPADPTFNAFRVPNVDNLYSNAFLDLTDGPVLVHIPEMGDRYYTLNFQDAYANATNLSSRTVGPGGGDFLVTAPHQWGMRPPRGARHAQEFRVATPYMWILLRIAKTVDEPDWQAVNQLQGPRSPSPRSPLPARPANSLPPTQPPCATTRQRSSTPSTSSCAATGARSKKTASPTDTALSTSAASPPSTSPASTRPDRPH